MKHLSVTLTFGVLLLGVGLRGLWLGAGVDASPWILVGGVVTASGVTLALQARDWYRRHRSLERGIELFDKRRLESPGEEP